LTIAALPLPPEIAKGAGYDASKMVSHRDLSWRPFNIYISDLSTTISRKYACADDLAIMHADGDRQAVEGALSKDMEMLGEYLQQ